MAKTTAPALLERVAGILQTARTQAARSVNTTQVVANWLIGREIVQDEQAGRRRAGYGTAMLKELAVRLKADFGSGYGVDNLELFRRFYLGYPNLLPAEISDAPRRKLGDTVETLPIQHAVRGESWQAGRLSADLSWTHYRLLVRVEKATARAFYEIEAIANSWSARELERQISSLLYERLALSKDKKGLMRLATRGHEIQQPVDVFKDPMVMEFLGLPESPKLVESKLEQALIDNLQHFLLELGKGFAFVSRQERITLDGDHFYIDLVFYHTVLKCYVLIDLKTTKLTHQDLGQVQLYVNYYDMERRTEGDNPSLGLILCASKNDAVVKYTLGPDQAQKIFASRYKLHLPTEDQLQAELEREVRYLSPPSMPVASKVAAKKSASKTRLAPKSSKNKKGEA
ncbi:PDDEXK nuclease domain-containing protein [Polaromonas sp. P1-6]|nr:PDDEXK nuclease domain-containing protein [Polaromonas sp. P1-6]